MFIYGSVQCSISEAIIILHFQRNRSHFRQSIIEIFMLQFRY